MNEPQKQKVDLLHCSEMAEEQEAHLGRAAQWSWWGPCPSTHLHVVRVHADQSLHAHSLPSPGVVDVIRFLQHPLIDSNVG